MMTDLAALPAIAGRVVVVGDYMTDIIVKPAGPMVRGSDQSADIVSTPGGSAANQAAWLAYFGVPVALVSRVAASERAAIAEQLEADGVTPLLQGDRTHQTGRLVTFLDETGERSFFTDRGANLNLRCDDLPADWLAGTGLLVVSGYALFDEAQRAEVLRMIAAARDAGVPVALDPGSTGFLKQVGPETFRDWTRGADLIFPNAEEAAVLAGTDDLTAQMRALGGDYGLVVVKTWPAGSAAGGAGGVLVTRNVPPLTPVDSTGAGDAFLAGFVSAWRKGDELAGCLDAGNRAGGAAVQKVGGRP